MAVFHGSQLVSGSEIRTVKTSSGGTETTLLASETLDLTAGTGISISEAAGVVTFNATGTSFDDTADHNLTGSVTFTPASGKSFPTIIGSTSTLTLQSNATAADDNYISEIDFDGLNSNSSDGAITYGRFRVQVDDVTDATEDANFSLELISNGTLVQALEVDAGLNTTAIGINAQATATSSIAIGGDGTIGNSAQAAGTASLAIGLGSDADGTNSIAIGRSADAHANGSMAVGYFTDVASTATNATALGYNANIASGHSNSTALGSGALTTAANQIMLGTSTETVVMPGSVTMSGLTGGGAGKVLGISSTGVLSVVDDGSGGITVTSTSVSDGTNTFNKYTDANVDTALGISSSGSTTKFLNEQGTFAEISSGSFDAAADHDLSGTITFTPASGKSFPEIVGTNPLLSFDSTEAQADGNEAGKLQFNALDSGSNKTLVAEIYTEGTDNANAFETGKIELRVKHDSTNNPVSYLDIDGDAENVDVKVPLVLSSLTGTGSHLTINSDGLLSRTTVGEFDAAGDEDITGSWVFDKASGKNTVQFKDGLLAADGTTSVDIVIGESQATAQTIIGNLIFAGEDASTNSTDYARIEGSTGQVVTNGSETGNLDLDVLVAGSFETGIEIDGGSSTANPRITIGHDSDWDIDTNGTFIGSLVIEPASGSEFPTFRGTDPGVTFRSTETAADDNEVGILDFYGLSGTSDYRYGRIRALAADESGGDGEIQIAASKATESNEVVFKIAAGESPEFRFEDNSANRVGIINNGTISDTEVIGELEFLGGANDDFYGSILVSSLNSSKDASVELKTRDSGGTGGTTYIELDGANERVVIEQAPRLSTVTGADNLVATDANGDLSSSKVDTNHLGDSITGRATNVTLSSSTTSATLDWDSDAVFEITLPGDSTNVTINMQNARIGITKTVLVKTGTTAHSGTITLGTSGSGTPTFNRLSAESFTQVASSTNYMQVTCIQTGTNEADTFIWTTAEVQS